VIRFRGIVETESNTVEHMLQGSRRLSSFGVEIIVKEKGRHWGYEWARSAHLQSLLLIFYKS
jgi:hypothetical protein